MNKNCDTELAVARLTEVPLEYLSCRAGYGDSYQGGNGNGVGDGFVAAFDGNGYGDGHGIASGGYTSGRGYGDENGAGYS